MTDLVFKLKNKLELEFNLTQMAHNIDITPGQYLIKDRYDHSEYLIDQPTYQYILDLIEFYHQSIYVFPDEDRVRVEKIDQDNFHASCEISINRLVFD